MESDILTVVVPCYNEQEVLPETVKELGGILKELIKKIKFHLRVKSYS